MREQHHEIGLTAGKIYQDLEREGPKPLIALQRDIGVSDSALFNQALGWLAREEKIDFEKKGKVWRVSLAREIFVQND